jgi:hypothetical protein
MNQPMNRPSPATGGAVSGGAALVATLGVYFLAYSAAAQGSGQGPSSSKAPRLTWAPPPLTAPTTILVTDSNHNLKLDSSKDYRIKMPATPLAVKGGLTISGGRNVVLIGGAIEAVDSPAEQRLAHRGLYLKGQTGTVHIEGLHIGGANLSEGINLDQREGAIVQIQNVRIEKVHGSFSGHHADLLQTWAGPAELRIDRLTGSTDYQGFFLLPNQHFKGAPPRRWDLRHINISGSDKSAYLLWRQIKPAYPVRVRDVWVRPNPKKQERDQFLWPKPSSGDRSWQDVQVGLPPGGDFVPAGVAGISYSSPGYQTPLAQSSSGNRTVSAGLSTKDALGVLS